LRGFTLIGLPLDAGELDGLDQRTEERREYNDRTSLPPGSLSQAWQPCDARTVIAPGSKIGGGATSDFSGAHLVDATFLESDLSYVLLRESDLRGAVLVGATIVGADFTGASVDNVHVGKTQAALFPSAPCHC